METAMTILHLTLNRKWFDMIASGKKREEYREIKPYWNKRLSSKHYDAVRFRNGYSPSSPTMLIGLRSIHISLGHPEWGAPEDDQVYVLWLGDILEIDYKGKQQ